MLGPPYGKDHARRALPFHGLDRLPFHEAQEKSGKQTLSREPSETNVCRRCSYFEVSLPSYRAPSPTLASLPTRILQSFGKGDGVFHQAIRQLERSVMKVRRAVLATRGRGARTLCIGMAIFCNSRVERGLVCTMDFSRSTSRHRPNGHDGHNRAQYALNEVLQRLSPLERNRRWCRWNIELLYLAACTVHPVGLDDFPHRRRRWLAATSRQHQRGLHSALAAGLIRHRCHRLPMQRITAQR